MSLLALLTGISGLGGEVVYLKALDYSVGAAPVVRLVVVAGFIVGMGIGAVLSARVKRPWLVEAGMAVYSALWLVFFWDIVDFNADAIGALTPVVGVTWASALLGVAHLLVPTVALGITLPSVMEIGGRVGSVYALHALGALVAMALIEFVVYPRLGLYAAFSVLVGSHLIVAGLLFGRAERRRLQRLPFGKLSWELASVGVATGGYQGVWLIYAALVFRPFYFVAPAVIAVFLLGGALGAALFVRFRFAFRSALTCSVAGITVSTLLGVLWLSVDAPDQAFLVVPEIALLLLPAAVPIGSLFPAWVAERTASRGTTGAALLSLSAGNAVGVVLAGGVLVMVLSPVWVMFMLVALGAALSFQQGAKRASVALVLAALLAGVFTEDSDLIRGAWNPQQDIRIEHSVRGPGELTVIYSHAQSDGTRQRRLWQTGYSPMNLEADGGLLGESMVAAFGVVHAPRTGRALVLGAGSGRTAGFVASVFEASDVIDVGATVPEVLRILQAENYNLSENPNVQYFPMDGVLAPSVLSGQRYDLIVHTLHPGYVDRAAKLYTEEYLTRLAGLLAPDGVLVTWSDVTLSAEANQVYTTTLRAVLPEQGLFAVRDFAYGYNYFVVVSSREPLRHDLEALSHPAVNNDPAVLALRNVPMSELRLPDLPTSSATHRFDHPSRDFLTGGYALTPQTACTGSCRAGATLEEMAPCESGGQRLRNRACSRECEWEPWSEWSECE